MQCADRSGHADKPKLLDDCEWGAYDATMLPFPLAKLYLVSSGPTVETPSSSAQVSRQIYEQLGVAGLESRTSEDADQQTVERVLDRLNRTPLKSVLDAGCGYGRIAIPLAKAGYRVTGIDISPTMLSEAKRRGDEAGADIRWEKGDVCDLPFADDQFDCVLCMWLTFNELLHQNDQHAALSEMIRVVRPGGWCFIDGPPYMEDLGEPSDVEMERYTQTPHSGAFTEVPIHDCAAGRRFVELMAAVRVTRYALYVDDCPGRLRYFFEFWP